MRKLLEQLRDDPELTDDNYAATRSCVVSQWRFLPLGFGLYLYLFPPWTHPAVLLSWEPERWALPKWGWIWEEL